MAHNKEPRIFYKRAIPSVRGPVNSCLTHHASQRGTRRSSRARLHSKLRQLLSALLVLTAWCRQYCSSLGILGYPSNLQPSWLLASQASVKVGAPHSDSFRISIPHNSSLFSTKYLYFLPGLPSPRYLSSTGFFPRISMISLFISAAISFSPQLDKSW